MNNWRQILSWHVEEKWDSGYLQGRLRDWFNTNVNFERLPQPFYDGDVDDIVEAAMNNLTIPNTNFDETRDYLERKIREHITIID